MKILDHIREVYGRIGYQGELEDISRAVCCSFDLGKLKSNKLILIGYGDFNYFLETSKGKYFVKVFASSRNDNYCERFAEVVAQAVKAKVRTPKLYRSDQGFLHILKLHGCNLRLSVMEYISGQDVYSAKGTLEPGDVRIVARQAALINSADFKPDPVYGPWLAENFLEEFEKTRGVLSTDDLKLIQPLVKEFESIRVTELPHCFVHGDIVSTNTMKDDENQIWIVDFGTANYSPRVQELANIDVGLLFNPDNEKESRQNRNLALEEYQRFIRFTDRELTVLPTYTRLSHAMNLMGTSYAARNFPSEENKYWYRRAKAGLTEITC